MKESKEPGKEVEEKYEINRRITFNPSIEASANILSRIFFIWTQKLMSKGAEKPLEMNDLFDLKPDEEPRYAYDKFCEGYEARGSNSTESTKAGFWHLLGWTWIVAGIFAIIANALQFAGPLMIKQILQFVTGSSGEADYMGYVWASVLVGCYLIRSLVMQHAFHLINLAAVKCMNSSTSKIYFKVLKLSSASRKYLETGSIMNYINVDTQAFQFFIQMSTFLFSAPVMIVVAIALTVVEVSWIGLCAPVIFLIGLYFQQKFMKKAYALRKDQLFWTDKRSKCVNEYFSGIRIVKYYGWEKIVSDKIETIRKEELKINFKGLLLRSYVEVLMNMLPIVASVIVFTVFVQVHGADSLKTETVYTTISLFNLMSNPMRMLVMTVVQYANAKASLTRVDHFFGYPEAKTDGINVNDESLEPGELKI
jgi:ABC-type multidrug transport system fused ATPase/permease subunit